MITSGYQNLLKFIHLISKEGERNKYEKYSEKFIKTLENYELVHFLSCSRRFLLREPSKGIWALKGHSGTQRALGHSRDLGTGALEGFLGTRALRALRALGHSKDTWALKALEVLYLADSNKSILQKC